MRAVVLHSRLSSSFPRLLPKKDNPRTNFFAVCALLITATQIPHRRNFISMSQFPLVHVPCVSLSLSPCLIHDPSNQLPPRLALTLTLTLTRTKTVVSHLHNLTSKDLKDKAEPL